MLRIVRRYYLASQHYVNFHAIALAPTPFMLDKPETVLAELEADMPRSAFTSARDRGETSELSLILNLVKDGET
jgi:hypothetical protein